MDKHSKNIFCEYTVKSWEDCLNLFRTIDGWVFRGQSNSDWALKTTLERGAEIHSTNFRDTPVVEANIIEKFQRRANHYSDNTPEKEDILEWLSLIQHHGGPTRLLDFSYSYYISLFFSIDQAFQESAVYCLNKKLVSEKGLETEVWRGLPEGKTFGTREYCNYALKEQTLSPLVMLVEPFNIHERLSRQQGLFVVPFEGRQSFEYNLSLTVNRFQKSLPKSRTLTEFASILDVLANECALLKVKIPKSLHNEIRSELKLMNITSETLFPGIDGFSKSLFGEFELN
ncbi:FRG domain-containing protein [Photobacterium carnosum]|uniref:FRG domain-containing protein n=1 Tax=Photobacterium carnosum TaxID=2023717 RepID=UPI001E593BEC